MGWGGAQDAGDAEACLCEVKVTEFERCRGCGDVQVRCGYSLRVTALAAVTLSGALAWGPRGHGAAWLVGAKAWQLLGLGALGVLVLVGLRSLGCL